MAEAKDEARALPKQAEIVEVTRELYSDMTLEELEERLELQALMDGELSADACYIETCGTKTVSCGTYTDGGNTQTVTVKPLTGIGSS